MSVNTKHIYTVATNNGFSHQAVKDYISFEWNLESTKDLTVEQYKNLIKHLDKQSQGATMGDKIFVKGIWGQAPRDGAPSYCVGSISIKSDLLVAFLNEHTNDRGYVNIDITVNKTDPKKFNCILNEYQKKKEDGF